MTLENYQQLALQTHNMSLDNYDVDENNAISTKNGLLNLSKQLLKSRALNKTLLLDAITGSGKTVIAAEYIKRMFDQVLPQDENYIFFWLSEGDGGLIEQSKESVADITGGSVKVLGGIDASDITTLCEFSPRSVVFINWEKINKLDSAQQLIGRIWGKEGVNLYNLINDAKSRELKRIVIVDESHSSFNTPAYRKIMELLAPEFTLFMSATPNQMQVPTIDDRQKNAASIAKLMHKVDPDMVRESGRIKQGVRFNPKGNDLSTQDAEIIRNQIERMLKEAIDKRNFLESLYINEHISVKPLCLIQLPDETAGTKDLLDNARNTVINYLQTQNISEKTGRLAIWLQDSGRQKTEIKGIRNNNIEYLLFKQACALGWDCPRAHILVRIRNFRDILSPFDIQTIGRIARAIKPDKPNHLYASDDLNYAYVYCEDKEIKYNTEYETAIREIVPTRQTIKDEFQSDAEGVNILMERLDVIDYSALSQSNLKDRLQVKLKITEPFHGIFLLHRINGELMITELGEHKSGTINNNSHDDVIEATANDIEWMYSRHIRDILHEPPYSVNIIDGVLHYVLNDMVKNEDDSELALMKTVIANAPQIQSIFAQIYKENRKLEKRVPEHKVCTFTPCNRELNNAMVDYTKIRCLYIPHLVQPKNSNPEKIFIDFLDSNMNVKWWMKNEDSFGPAVLYFDSEQVLCPTYPDFLVRFTNGSLGLYEIKDLDDNDPNNELKDVSIRDFCKKQSYFGGVINVKNTTGGYPVLLNNPEFQ